MRAPAIVGYSAVLLGFACKRESTGPVPVPSASAPSSASTVASASANASSSAPKPPAFVGPRFLTRVFPDDTSASSEYRKGGEYHPSKDAFDGNRSSAWNQAGDKKGAPGEWLEERFDTAQKIHVVRVDTGFNEWSSKSGDLFLRNSHAKKISLVLDDGAPIVREAKADERAVTFRLDPPVTAKKARVTFDEVYPGDKYTELGVSEIATYVEPTKIVDEAVVDKAVDYITKNYEGDSAGRGAGLALTLGVPIPADLVTDQRARVSDLRPNLDGRGPGFRVVALTFRTRPDSGFQTRRQYLLVLVLGRVAKDKLALIAHDSVLALPDEFGFENDTHVSISLNGEGDDLAVFWAHTQKDLSGRRVRVAGLRIWSCGRGFPDPVFDQVFHRAFDATKSGFEMVALEPDNGSVRVRIDGALKTTFLWNAPSGIFVPGPE